MNPMHTVRKSLLVILLALLATPAVAQKSGGTLRENPSSASLHEESSITVMQPFMAVFNNLVIYDQQQEIARVAVYHSTSAACWHPYVKGYLRSMNGIYTHHRMEDVWIDK